MILMDFRWKMDKKTKVFFVFDSSGSYGHGAKIIKNLKVTKVTKVLIHLAS